MPDSSYDVIIVGAGFAGLAAARELGQRGKRVLVLEGKDRLGGRAWSSELSGVPIELGGGYIYWSQPHMWAEVTRYQLNVIERPYYANTNSMRQTRFLMNEKLRNAFTEDEAKEIKQAFMEFVEPARTTFPNPYQPFENENFKKYDSLSNEDRINQLGLNELQRASLMRTASMQCNNAPSAGGYIEALRWYALANFHDETYAGSVSRFTLAEGTAHLLKCIADDAGAEIILNAKVAELEHSDDGVRVRSGHDNYFAEYCVMATGVNVWKNIQFSPGVSDHKMRLSQEELSGKGSKIYVRLRGEFADSRWSAIDGPILSVLPHDVGSDASTVVVFTNPNQPFTQITKDTLQTAIDRFDDSFEVLDFKFHDWVSDDLVAGTWGNFRPNQFTSYFKNALEPEGRVHFASGDIAVGWRGFFDGALESGIRAARKILTTD